MTQHTVFAYQWSESERGWGTKPDGISLHLTKELAKKYVTDFNSALPYEIPDTYSYATTCNPMFVTVTDEVLSILKERENLRLYSGYSISKIPGTFFHIHLERKTIETLAYENKSNNA